jgi:uncharacterized protein (DUF302 family)
MIMNYYFSRTIQTTFEDALSRAVEALGKEGFGVLVDIDVARTMKEKLNVDFRKYRILGVCNPALAYEALQAEDKIGTLLPCNVIVQEVPGVGAEIAALDPAASLRALANPVLDEFAFRVRDRLKRALDRAA